MPIYEYQCQACSNELEVLQKISAAPLQNCPKCSEPALKKKVSAAAFRLKGGGWYETDFKTGNKKNLAGGSESSTGGDSAGGAANSAGGQSKSTGGASKSDSKSKSKGEGKKSA